MSRDGLEAVGAYHSKYLNIILSIDRCCNINRLYGMLGGKAMQLPVSPALFTIHRDDALELDNNLSDLE